MLEVIAQADELPRLSLPFSRHSPIPDDRSYRGDFAMRILDVLTRCADLIKLAQPANSAARAFIETSDDH